MKTIYLLPITVFLFVVHQGMGQKTLLDLRFQSKEKKKAAVHVPIVSTKRFYDHRGAVRHHAIRIHPTQLYSTFRVGYENAIHRKVGVGATASWQFRDENKGTAKIEVYGKYFLTYRAPIGLYVYNSHGVAHMANHAMNYKLTSVGPEEKFNYNRPYVLSEQASYTTYIGSLGIGFQNITGKRKNVIIDFGLGYQYYILPNRFKTSYNQFNAIYSNFTPSNHVLGPMSPISLRFAVGYAF